MSPAPKDDTSPHLGTLLHHLTQCPSDFLTLASRERAGQLLAAVICDHFRDTLLLDNDPFILDLLQHPTVSEQNIRHRSLMAVGIWLLHHEWFRGQADKAKSSWKWVRGDRLKELSMLVPAEHFVTDPDRREELTRLCLASMDVIPSGETKAQADDRRTTLDSIERQRILMATAAAEKRAREVREAMAQAKARESASRYGE